MTVKELISALQRLDQDKEVVVRSGDEGPFNTPVIGHAYRLTPAEEQEDVVDGDKGEEVVCLYGF